jgi:hypothetical protein
MKKNYSVICSSEVMNSLGENLLAAKGPKKSPIDVFRAAFWYTNIVMRLHSPSAYDVEMIVERTAFNKSKSGDSYHTNKWSKYETGSHVPHFLQVDRAERILPGTEWILNHVLWDTLKLSKPIEKNANKWLKRLDPAIQSLVFKKERRGVGNNYARADVNIRLLSQLERRAGMDALACLTILLREAHEQGATHNTLDIGNSIYRVLLIFCSISPSRGLENVLFQIYCTTIFPMACHKDIGFKFEEFDFDDAVKRLRCLLSFKGFPIKTKSYIEDKIYYADMLLKGEYGYDIKFALEAPKSPRSAPSDNNRDDWKSYFIYEKLREWGMSQMFLRQSEREICPPADLFSRNYSNEKPTPPTPPETTV